MSSPKKIKKLSLSQNATPDEATDPEVPAQHGQQLGEFKIGDLFEKVSVRYYGLEARYSDVSSMRTDEYHVPVTSAKRGDNGICRWAKSGQFETHSNVISIVYNGAIAAGLVYYQPSEVSALADSYLIRLKALELTAETGLYLAAAIQKVTSAKYSRENKAVWPRVSKEAIILPVDASGEPDWEFMARYVRAMKKLVIADVVKYKDEVLEATRSVAGEAS